MSSLTIAFIAFLCVSGSVMLAIVVARILPDHHLNTEARDVLKLGMALIATLAALVLGLLVATAKGAFDTQASAVQHLSADVILLDRMLSLYGPETDSARHLLRGSVELTLQQVWPESSEQGAHVRLIAAHRNVEEFFAAVAGLSPQQGAQVVAKARALQAMAEIAGIRSQMLVQSDTSMPTPILAVLIFWLIILFAGYGLLAPRNPTVIASLLVCALSVSGAIFMILELARPFDGVVHVSSAPLREALAHLGED